MSNCRRSGLMLARGMSAHNLLSISAACQCTLSVYQAPHQVPHCLRLTSLITFILVLVRSGMKGSACPEQLHSWGIVRGHRGTYHGIKRGESPGKVDDRHFSCCLHLAVYQVVGRKKTVGGKCIQGNQTQSASTLVSCTYLTFVCTIFEICVMAPMS